jgi:alanyl-tRNA synthetase
VNSAEIRQRWLDFFEKDNRQGIFHTVVPSASLVLNDPNLLLVNAGMVPFKPYFLGEVPPPYPRATSVQKCVRTLDIDEVGKTTRHASFFQMCGNFSFGDYFKEGAISLAWELLTRGRDDGGYGFDPERLWVTIYHDDDEAADIWHHQVGVPKERIQRRGMADNFWSMGVPGPCGPCSEIYFDRGPQYGREGGPIADEDRYLEIWNLVFMQNIRGEGPGKENFPIVGELPAKSIDTGLGLERTAALLQGVENIYEIDTTSIILRKASELTDVSYGKKEASDISLRVIADHARTAAMLIGDGVTPGNEGRGYVLRRMMRRVIRNMRILGSEDPTLVALVRASIEAMSPQYPELRRDQKRIEEVTGAEENIFLETLKSGTNIFDLAAETVKKQNGKVIPASEVFKLHDTYGFPFDLTLEMAQEIGLDVDEKGFRSLMREQRDRAKADAKAKKTGHTDLTEYRKILESSHLSEFIGYESTKAEGRVVGLLSQGKSVSSASGEIEVILDRTSFYAEGGGQLADHGQIHFDNGAVFEVYDVQSPIPGLIVHRGELISGEVEISQKSHAVIDEARRIAISRSHTATHMVHKAFREILGETATQAGSENSPGRFRFDFPSVSPVSSDLLAEVEGKVNEVLLENLEVTAEVMSQDEALALGAMALFGEKYGDRVRVISVGEWAKELCGGTHVHSSGELGLIKLLSESSIGSGVRRVEALVGRDAFNFLAREHILLQQVSELVKVTRHEELAERISSILTSLKDAEKELYSFKINNSVELLQKQMAQAPRIAKIKYFSHLLDDGLSADQLREISLALRNQDSCIAITLMSVNQGKVVLVAAVDESARSLGVKAGSLVKAGSNALAGGGGGKDDFAQGGGSDPSQIGAAMEAMASLVLSLEASSQ